MKIDISNAKSFVKIFLTHPIIKTFPVLYCDLMKLIEMKLVIALPYHKKTTQEGGFSNDAIVIKAH